MEEPTLTQSQVIEELEYNILIHEGWAGYVVEYPEYSETMGDYDWHMRWIEVYENAIFYLQDDTSIPIDERVTAWTRRTV